MMRANQKGSIELCPAEGRGYKFESCRARQKTKQNQHFLGHLDRVRRFVEPAT
jgi:hypothetical protein